MRTRNKRGIASVPKSSKKAGETSEQQIQRQLAEKQYKNQLGDIIGKWPGDESFEDLLKQLSA